MGKAIKKSASTESLKWASFWTRCLPFARTGQAEQTKESPRAAELCEARIVDIQQETPTVKRLRLSVEGQPFTFLPGQWVDFYAPGDPTAGGFSIFSSLRQLQQSRTFELAIKQNPNPPAPWVHSEAKVGDAVQVRVGGTFYAGPADLRRRLLLVAGGIGITPLASILTSAIELAVEEGRHNDGLRAVLLYSVSQLDELALRRDLEELLQRAPKALEVQFRVTSSAASEQDGAGPHVTFGRRFNQNDLLLALEGLGMQPDAAGPAEGVPSDVEAYLCGPPKMTDDVAEMLHNLGMPLESIKYEKWW